MCAQQAFYTYGNFFALKHLHVHHMNYMNPADIDCQQASVYPDVHSRMHKPISNMWSRGDSCIRNTLYMLIAFSFSFFFLKSLCYGLNNLLFNHIPIPAIEFLSETFPEIFKNEIQEVNNKQTILSSPGF